MMHVRRSINTWILGIGVFALTAGMACAEGNRVQVDCTRSQGEVQAQVFGSNLLAHDPAFSCTESWAKNYTAYREFGAGVWNSRQMEAVPAVLDLGKEAGVSLMRFPGGCGSHGYQWKKAIQKGRNSFKFGLYEFYKVCQGLHAEPVITLSYFNDTPQDGADLVAFLNGPQAPAGGKAPAKRPAGTDWPALRAEVGHPQPLGVKYFEIGNEVWHGDHLRTRELKPEVYAQRYLQYYDAMKAVDPTVQIGLVLDTDAWNQKVLPIVKNKVDFGILHTYPAPGYGKELEAMPVDKLFSMSLGMPEVLIEPHYQVTLRMLKANAGKSVPLAITEFNGGFFMRSKIPYQFSLGNALINAELIRIFMKPENNILMANNWNFINEHWGMIANGFDNDLSKFSNPYIKRPNFYVFKLYHDHFGQSLLPVTVASATYSERGYTVPYLTVNASTNRDRSKVYLMLLNKNLKDAMPVEVALAGVGKTSRAEGWVLNGPDYLATNEKNPETVAVKAVQVKAPEADGRLSLVLEPHSLTAVEISK